MVPLTLGHSTTVVGAAVVDVDEPEDVRATEDSDFEADVDNGIPREEEGAEDTPAGAEAEDVPAALSPLYRASLSFPLLWRAFTDLTLQTVSNS